MWMTDKKLSIDLNSPCDAYTLLEGTVSAGAVVSGAVFTFSPGGGHTIGRFSAQRIDMADIEIIAQ